MTSRSSLQGHDSAALAVAGTEGGGDQTVRPLSGKPESMLLLFIVLAVLICEAGYFLLRPERVGPPVALSWQVLSFDGLGPVDQAIHSALSPASEEIIWNNNDTGDWMSIKRAQQILLPPFYRDGFWKTNGKVQWQLILPGSHQAQAHSNPSGEGAEHDEKDAQGGDPATPSTVFTATQGVGATVYYGAAGQAPGQGAYLLVIGHAHAGVMWSNQATIWIHRDPNAPYPSIVKPEALIGQGWRQIIPYDGAREVERVKGKP